MAVVFDAQKEYDSLEKSLKLELKPFLNELCLASVAVGENYSTSLYRGSQQKIAKKLGIEYSPIDLKADISFEDFKSEIEALNDNKTVTGIIINKPFPSGWDEEGVFSLLAENKDVEGVHPANLGKLFIGDKAVASALGENPSAILISPTVRSILRALNLSDSLGKLYGKKVAIVGFSLLIGKPLALLLANALATVTIAQIGTYEKGDLAECVSGADIVISAVGVPHLIKGDWIKKGAIVIDVGTGKKDGKLTGDVEFDAASKKAAFITPVPGGVGKLTTMFLYYNLIIAAKFKS